MLAGDGREALLAQHHRSVLEPAQQLLTGGPAVGLDVLQLHRRGLGAVLEAELRARVGEELRWWPVDGLPDGLEAEMHDLIAIARARTLGRPLR